ncbi:Thioredoxin family protein [Trichomonas vaginalis G3]|uniref:Thioredoxin family protein n=1 Tax=Trichomonas vaginalis (strain ATCC PRA-98 / G3) TaxID=412133 RepID=A2FVZ8_TRIV3|nr:cell redox homeostasis [Trichomonas vaginalis G3]EAX90927.1 Thioredoxin family protein [Trichomonas vaginalis G3]KAI5516457.1 cell redox homeostasis [Trichomonas vaginalis G3]|eukprot:XP_001303857.1 Thioredoxin family protein [Trichomonas vaginalis G3]
MSDPIVHFQGSNQDLLSRIKEASGLVVVDFFATWCPPCQYLGKILPSISQDNKDVTFIKVDIDQNDDATTAFNVSSIPSLFIMKKDGDEITTLDHFVGADVARIMLDISKFK